MRITPANPHQHRPLIITALIILFAIGTAASFLSAISLAFPGSFLESIWHLNPHARESFARIGVWAIVLMTVVCLACVCAAIGLWRGRPWGYWLAVIMLVLNLAGDIINVLTGTEPRAAVGIPIVLLILVLLIRQRPMQIE